MGRARAVVVQKVYYQEAGQQPLLLVDQQYSYAVATDEQPYTRTFRVGEEWTPLDAGWLKDAGASEMVLLNQEGQQGNRIRSPEEEAEIASRIVEVGLVMPEPAGRTMHSPPKREPEPLFPVAPQRSMRVPLPVPGRLALRCRKGEARVTLVLLPQ